MTAVDDASELPSYVDDGQVVELAWNLKTGAADFIIIDRATGEVARADQAETSFGTIVPPAMCYGIVTPGGDIPGTVRLPADLDQTGEHEDRLREDVAAHIHRYVELPGGMEAVAVEYAFLSWAYDSFDELPYLGFKTADAGRGKSRALETVGAICYRPIPCGGGSTAAATLRLIDGFRGTLVADEMDATKDSELSSEVAKILNQGFQRNRPLVRCSGNNNDPKPYSCFGPKLFALRKGFGDDATETRVITVPMRARTRRDIPIAMPRREFDRSALALRNRLLAWRCANLSRVKVDPSLMDDRLEDRQNQIGLALLSLAPSALVRTRIVDALLDQQANIAADRGDRLPGEVFAAVLAVVAEDGVVRPGDVARLVNTQRAKAKGIDVYRLGKAALSSHRVTAHILDSAGSRWRSSEGGARPIPPCGYQPDVESLHTHYRRRPSGGVGEAAGPVACDTTRTAI